MKLSNKTISKLVKYVIGDNYDPYRTGSQILELFNEYGNYDYLPSKGMPMMPNNYLKYSRRSFAEQKMVEMNDTEGLRQLLEYVINQMESPISQKEIESILLSDGYSLSEDSGTYSINGGFIDHTKSVQNVAHFQNLEKQVIDAIDQSKVSICIAMAWFTNERIKDKLLEKQKTGVDVDIVIYDDGVNKKHGVDLSEFSYTAVKGSRGGIMHNKFCVIDNQTILTGSYNWTNNAETKNDEVVTILKDPERASEFTLKFKELKKQKAKNSQ